MAGKATSNAYTRFGYLDYAEMLNRLESGKINEHDVIFSKDRLTTYIISDSLQPVELRSRVYVFDSISEAESKLNTNKDTYIGQIVAIKNKNVYKGYIVNLSPDEKYIVCPFLS